MTRPTMLLPRRSGPLVIMCLAFAATMMMMITVDSESSSSLFVNGFVGHQRHRQRILQDPKQHNTKVNNPGAFSNTNHNAIVLLLPSSNERAAAAGVALHAEKRYGAEGRRERREKNRQSRRERAERKDASDRDEEEEEEDSSTDDSGANKNNSRSVVGLLKWPFQKIRSTMRRRSSTSS